MVKYQKVGTSFIFADILLNKNKKISLPRKKKYGFNIGYSNVKKKVLTGIFFMSFDFKTSKTAEYKNEYRYI